MFLSTKNDVTQWLTKINYDEEIKWFYLPNPFMSNQIFSFDTPNKLLRFFSFLFMNYNFIHQT